MDLIKSEGNWKADRDYFTDFSAKDREDDCRALAEARKKGPGFLPKLKCDSTNRGVVLDAEANSLVLLVTTLAEDWLTYDVLNCPAEADADKTVVWNKVTYSLSPKDVTVMASLDEKAGDEEWAKVYEEYGFGK